jgi:diguanylate cyclase (GGDEF)-like protein
MEERLDAELAFAIRHGAELSVIMLDVDFFKKVNDNHGHPAGDAVLRHVAAALGKALRTEDLLARYGGEEFVVVTRGTSLEEARVLSERLRRAIEESRIELPLTAPGAEALRIQVTASFGAAALGECAVKEKGALLQLADERLYRAKQSGRNRVCAG